MGYPITLIPGNGAGQEVTEATQRVLAATGVAIDWQMVSLEVDALSQAMVLPDSILASLQVTKVALMEPIAASVDDLGLLHMHLAQELNLFANVCPTQAIPGRHPTIDQMDLVIIHDISPQVTAGIEFDRSSVEAAEARSFLARLTGQPLRADAALGIHATSVLGSYQIIELAFRYAQTHGHHQVTVAHRANRLKHTDGLFLAVAQEVAQDYRNIKFSEESIEHLCTQLMRKPETYNVIVMPHVYGELLCHLCAGVIGDADRSPKAMIGENYAVFTPMPTAGGQSKPTGQACASTSGLILSGALMLEHLGEVKAAHHLRRAVMEVIRETQTSNGAVGDLQPLSPMDWAAAIAQQLTELN